MSETTNFIEEGPIQPVNFFEEEREPKKLDWKMKLLLVLITPFAVFYVKKLADSARINRKEEEKERRKIKFFKPTITEGFFSNKVKWEMRDAPLTDEQVNEFFKDRK